MSSAQPQPTRTYGPFTGGTNAVGTQVDTDLNTVYTVLQGGIGDTHIADNASIQLSKLQAASWTAWTPSFSGFSVSPTVTCRYALVGKICTIAVYTVSNGTSSTNAFTMTLPFAAANVATLQKGVITVVDNGTNNVGWIATRQNSTTADLYLGVAGGTWTTSGAKAATFNFTYETV